MGFCSPQISGLPEPGCMLILKTGSHLYFRHREEHFHNLTSGKENLISSGTCSTFLRLELRELPILIPTQNSVCLEGIAPSSASSLAELPGLPWNLGSWTDLVS